MTPSRPQTAVLLTFFLFGASSHLATTGHAQRELIIDNPPSRVAPVERPWAEAPIPDIQGGSGDSWNVELVGRWAGGPSYALAARSDIVFLGDGGYLRIVDFADPRNPMTLGKIALPGLVRGVAVDGSYAFVGLGVAGVRVVDISNPALGSI